MRCDEDRRIVNIETTSLSGLLAPRNGVFRVFGVMVICIALGLLLGMPVSRENPSKKIVAEEIVLVDDEGRVRCTIGVDFGGAGVSLYDSSSVLRGRFWIGTGTPADMVRMELYDAEKNLRTVLGEARVGLHGEDALLRRPVSSLLLYSEEGEVIGRVPNEPWLDGRK